MRKNFNFVLVTFILFGLISLLLLANLVGKQTNLRGRAQAQSVQVQCSSMGTVQFAISFTNPETYSVDLLAEILLQTQTISRDYLNLAPGQTQNSVIQTNLSSLSNTGDVIFIWSPAGNPTDSKNITASFNSIVCEPSASASSPSSPSSQISNDQPTDSSILALTPLPPQTPAKPEPFYQAIFGGLIAKFQMLFYNLSRFFQAFNMSPQR